MVWNKSENSISRSRRFQAVHEKFNGFVPLMSLRFYGIGPWSDTDVSENVNIRKLAHIHDNCSVQAYVFRRAVRTAQIELEAVYQIQV